MGSTRPVGLILGGAAVLGLMTACLEPNQHTLVSITASHAASARVDQIVFTFQQGSPTASSARYVPTAPAGLDGRPVVLDGSTFVQVDLTPAIAHDSRGDSTTPQAVYFPGITTNVREAKQYEDSKGHVGYALGLISAIPGSHPTVTRTANAIEVSIPTR